MSPLHIPQSGVSSGRPTIDHLMDCVCDVYRPTETKGTMRETKRTYALIHADLPCAVKRKTTRLTTEEGGLVAKGFRTVYFSGMPIPQIRERDVVKIKSGPVAPARLEVESPSAPKGHHTECGVGEFTGKLPGDP